jgi:putative ABC transport system permease protein
MNRLMAAIGAQYPDSSGGWRVSVLKPYDALFSTNDRLARPLLLVLAGCVLLLACANVANLLLVRSIGRRREMAIRKSMGAGVGALVRQISAESLWLAVPACAAAVLFADWSVPLLLKGFPGLDLQTPKNIVDYPVVAFTGAIAMASIFVFSLAPLWQAQRSSIADAMRSAGARTGADRRSRRLSSGFVVVQAALAMGLVGSAILVSKAMYQAVHLDPGYNTKNVLQVRADLARARYANDRTGMYFERAVQRVSALPGVVSASAISVVPYVEGNGVATTCAVEGTAERKERLPRGSVIAVLPGAIETLQIPLRRGRSIEARDNSRSLEAVVVNEAAVRRLWPDRDPIGRRVRLEGMDGRWFTVVGVAGDVRRTNIVQRIEPVFFVAAAQAPVRSMAVIVRTAGPAEAALPGVRSAMQAIDPEEPLVADTIEAAAYRGIQGGVTFAGLLCVMGGLSLFLAAIGLFSVLAYQVWDRRRDIGVRIALGASRANIVREFVGQVAWLAVPGLMLGAALAVALGQRVQAVLYGVAISEPMVLGGAMAALVAATVLAAVVPARRAASVDPGAALRQD